MTKKQAITHIAKYNDRVVAYKSEEPKELFLAKYKKGVRWKSSTSDVESYIRKITWFENSEVPFGLVEFMILGDLTIEEEANE